jgi:hypothetical protein
VKYLTYYAARGFGVKSSDAKSALANQGGPQAIFIRFPGLAAKKFVFIRVLSWFNLSPA